MNINPSAAQLESGSLPLEKGQQLNRVSISSGNTENWGESNMADGSPRTDISTDADTDDKNQRVLFLSYPPLIFYYILNSAILEICIFGTLLAKFCSIYILVSTGNQEFWSTLRYFGFQRAFVLLLYEMTINSLHYSH